jgi:serine/threonine-protein phosphatase 4 regulatory subunit 1
MAGQSRRLLRAQTSLNTVYVIRVDVLFSDDFDSLEDEVVEVSPLDEESEDDCIDPLLFVQKYINSDDILKRQRVARSLADAMRWTEGEADVEVVLRAAEQLSTDFEPRVRIDVIEELPDITAFCLEDSRSIDTILNRLLPILARYLCDINDQIRKSGHVILFSLLEHQLIGSVDVEHFMVPVLSQMCGADSCMSQLEAARVVMKVAPMMEPEVIYRVFLPLIKTLAAAQYFEVRKTCASTFGPLAQAVDGDVNDKVVLPLFRALCTDSVWGVRKGCCEAFVDVSYACTLEQRQDILCPLFLTFLQDSSKWVSVMD